MREVLGQPSDDEDDESQQTPNSNLPGPDHGQSSFAIYSPEFLPSMESALEHPTRSQIHSLYASFITNVDPLIKLLHGPSLRRYLIEGAENLDCSPGPTGWDALKFAIYYSTTTSLTPEECLERLREEKTVLLPRFRSGTEFALAKADFVNTEEVSALQALVLYLVSRSLEIILSAMWVSIEDQ